MIGRYRTADMAIGLLVGIPTIPIAIVPNPIDRWQYGRLWLEKYISSSHQHDLASLAKAYQQIVEMYHVW